MKVLAIALFSVFLTGVYLSPCNFYSSLVESYGSSFVQTADQGFAIAGFTSYEGITHEDALVIKTNSSGDQLWMKRFGGKHEDGAFSIIENSDKDLIVCGFTDTFGNLNYDSWIIKINEKGDHIWNKTVKIINGSACLSIIQDLDGGYVFTGLANYSDSPDILLVKVDKKGKMLWHKTYGGEKDDVGLSVVHAKEGGYVITGYTSSLTNGKEDVCVIKTNKKGDKIWSKVYGGPENDRGHSIINTDDEGFVIAGFTQSFGEGLDDIWLIKLDHKGNKLWNKTFGGIESDRAFSVVRTSDNGLAITGFTNSFGAGNEDLWIIKTDANGTHLWNRTFGGIEKDRGRCIVQTISGPLAVIGYTASYEESKVNVWLLKSHCEKESFISNLGCQLSSSTSPPEECNCPAGKFMNAELHECLSCPAGFYNNEYLNEKCYSCPPGKFSKEGAAFCQNCPNGTYSPKKGSTECITCFHACLECTVANKNAGCHKCRSNFKLVGGQCIEKTSTWPKYAALLVVLIILLGMAYSIYYKNNENENPPSQESDVPLMPVEEKKAAEGSKPEEEKKSVEEPKPVEEPKHVEEKKPAEEAKKSEEPPAVTEPPKEVKKEATT